jgi:hypothetical protein
MWIGSQRPLRLQHGTLTCRGEGATASSLKADTCFIKFRVVAGATGLKKWRFSQHMKSPGHVCAMGFISTGKVEDANALPSPEAWQSVYTSIIKGTGMVELGKKKVECMQYCLAEAKRRETMVCLKRAVAVTISQDKRGTRFLMRFRACDDKLQVSDGVLCISREVGDVHANGADKLRQATMIGIEHACTKLPPPGVVGRHRELDRDLYDSLCLKIEAFASDAASDQQLAGRELQCGDLAGPQVRALRGTLSQSLPNLKVAVRCCHANSQIILSNRFQRASQSATLVFF